MTAPRCLPPLAALAVALAAATAPADTFTIRPGDEGTLVKFVSKAAMETFDGKTRAVSGHLELDPAAPVHGFTISVEVDMATLETGIGLRDRHMRENHLHTDLFPQATFTGAEVAEGGDDALTPGEPRRLRLAGTLTIHGVPRDVTVPADLTWDGADRLQFASRFPVALADHGIPRPQFLVMKLGDVQQVEVTLEARRTATSPGMATSARPASEDPAPGE